MPARDATLAVVMLAGLALVQAKSVNPVVTAMMSTQPDDDVDELNRQGKLDELDELALAELDEEARIDVDEQDPSVLAEDEKWPEMAPWLTDNLDKTAKGLRDLYAKTKVKGNMPILHHFLHQVRSNKSKFVIGFLQLYRRVAYCELTGQYKSDKSFPVLVDESFAVEGSPYEAQTAAELAGDLHKTFTQEYNKAAAIATDLDATADRPASNKGVAIFVLGPAAAGKTTTVKNSMQAVLEENTATFVTELQNIDGGLMREKSAAWQELLAIRTHLKVVGWKDMQKFIIEPAIRVVKKNILADLVARKKDIIIPDTASVEASAWSQAAQRTKLINGCIFSIAYDSLKAAGYQIIVVAINTDRVNTVAQGTKRGLDEGKIYSAASWRYAHVAIVNIINRLRADGNTNTFLIKDNNAHPNIAKLQWCPVYNGLNAACRAGTDLWLGAGETVAKTEVYNKEGCTKTVHRFTTQPSCFKYIGLSTHQLVYSAGVRRLHETCFPQYYKNPSDAEPVRVTCVRAIPATSLPCYLDGTPEGVSLQTAYKHRTWGCATAKEEDDISKNNGEFEKRILRESAAIVGEDPGFFDQHFNEGA